MSRPAGDAPFARAVLELPTVDRDGADFIGIAIPVIGGFGVAGVNIDPPVVGRRRVIAVDLQERKARTWAQPWLTNACWASLSIFARTPEAPSTRVSSHSSTASSSQNHDAALPSGMSAAGPQLAINRYNAAWSSKNRTCFSKNRTLVFQG